MIENAINCLKAAQSLEGKQTFEEAKAALYEAYDKIKAEEVQETINQIQSAHSSRQYCKAWKIINRISARKVKELGQVSGPSPEARVSTWFNHMKNLLGCSLSNEDPDESFPDIFTDLNIDEGPFSKEEYFKV